MKVITEYPENITREALGYLRAYKRVFITREYGKYTVSTGLGLKQTYGSDHELNEYYAADQYTPAQRQLNYVMAFHEYPADYRGKRNYAELRTVESWDTQFIFDDDGNIIPVC